MKAKYFVFNHNLILKSVILGLCLISEIGFAGVLKSVVSDFDGLDINQVTLPDGSYSGGDMNWKVAANPLGNNDMLVDRVLQLNLNWNSGQGLFGKSINRFIELDPAADKLNFYFYNPLSNPGDASIDAVIQEDDHGGVSFNSSLDDEWIKNIIIPRKDGWQLISLPLSSFVHGNAGGNGKFDNGYTHGGGQIFNVEIRAHKVLPSETSANYYIDMIAFSEGDLPLGQSILNLPSKPTNAYALLGAYSLKSETFPDQVPQEVESVFPADPSKKIKYVNWFLPFSKSSSSPDNFPGVEVTNLLNNHYRPVITWEALYAPFARLDPQQPRLDKINNGSFDAYFDAFGDKLKSYNDTIIIRLMHEFEGDWYPWSLTQNNNDPQAYISAFRHVVDRVRARGATKVLWMWCVNAFPKPYLKYNWIVSAYPGDQYVNIVATDVYNHPDLGSPAWKSFRYQTAETYYYLTKYFPQKPFYICEVACRERNSDENPNSQKKCEWVVQMNKEIQSLFNKSRAVIFFSSIKEHDWRVNSSPCVQDAYTKSFWNDSFYFNTLNGIQTLSTENSFNVYPNPFINELNLVLGKGLNGNEYTYSILDITGKSVYSFSSSGQGKVFIDKNLTPGIYLLELKTDSQIKYAKLVKQ
jgi:hypothetical protein